MIAVIDYRAGNLASVQHAFAALGIPARITHDPAEILAAERVVFPGVGAAGASMRVLEERGLAPAIRAVVARGTPFLGICVGCQIVLERSEEDGGVQTLGLLPGCVRRFPAPDPAAGRRDKVPHMGWNDVRFAQAHPVFQGLPDDPEFYFVHSYYPEPTDPATAVAHTAYAGVRFASILAKGSLVASQFHIEKSGRLGLQVLRNFSAWTGTWTPAPAVRTEAGSC